MCMKKEKKGRKRKKKEGGNGGKQMGREGGKETRQRQTYRVRQYFFSFFKESDENSTTEKYDN